MNPISDRAATALTISKVISLDSPRKGDLRDLQPFSLTLVTAVLTSPDYGVD